VLNENQASRCSCLLIHCHVATCCLHHTVCEYCLNRNSPHCTARTYYSTRKTRRYKCTRWSPTHRALKCCCQDTIQRHQRRHSKNWARKVDRCSPSVFGILHPTCTVRHRLWRPSHDLVDIEKQTPWLFLRSRWFAMPVFSPSRSRSRVQLPCSSALKYTHIHSTHWNICEFGILCPISLYIRAQTCARSGVLRWSASCSMALTAIAAQVSMCT